MKKVLASLLMFLLCVSTNAQVKNQDHNDELFTITLSSYTALHNGLDKDLKNSLVPSDFPYAGIGMFFITTTTEGNDATETINIVIYRVLKDSPAGQAGIKPGSIITSVNGGSVQTILKRGDGIGEKRITASQILFSQLAAALHKDRMTIEVNQKIYVLDKTKIGAAYGKYLLENKTNWDRRFEQNTDEAQKAITKKSYELLDRCFHNLKALEKDMFSSVYFME